MKSLIFASMALALAVSCSGEKRHDATSSGASEPVARTDTETALRHTAALDSRSPGPEWIWISPTTPPTSEKQTVRSLAYYQPGGTFIQAFEMDWERGDPASAARADLKRWKETYPDGTFTAVTISEDGKVAGFSFTHHSGHAEGRPQGCFAQYAFVRVRGVDGLVRVTSEGPIDLHDAAASAFGIVLDTLESKTLP